jgi:hypothetical protein
MRKLIISRRLWWMFAWGAAIAVGLGFRCELNYRDRLASLPSLVDERGNSASLEAAVAGLEAYERAGQVRKCGFVSLGAAAVLFICAAATKRKETDDVDT